MIFGVFVPQGWKMELASIDGGAAKWAKAVEIATLAEQLGFDSIWVYDHFHNVPRPAHEAVFECWTTVAAISQLTSTIRLGQMVGCASYRNPALLAKITSTVDVISGGRLDWGIGAGWYENEYLAYGYDFPRPAERIARLADTVEIVKRMWSEPDATFGGRYLSVSGAQCDPKPLQQPHPPIWIGGGGEQLTLRVVAEHADYSNFGGDLATWTHKRDVLRSHCDAVGRDAAEIRMTWSPEILLRGSERGSRRGRQPQPVGRRTSTRGGRATSSARRSRSARSSSPTSTPASPASWRGAPTIPTRRRSSCSPATSSPTSADTYEDTMDLLALYAQATPAKAALIDDHDGTVRQLTYAELDAEANRLANVLVDRGVAAGDKVAWCGQNSVGVVVLLCAAQRLGATAVPGELPVHRRRSGVRDRPQRRHGGVRRRRAGVDAGPHPRRPADGAFRARVRRGVPGLQPTGGSPPSTS